ncbi:amino acid permease [Pseudofulvimonas gallinarii]|jgi:APA family basic amino acid/polyamine antiporter|uniref:Amino acid/polyamine/organocation transporter (APC superfamily) n=1 Tax=Pseudofulvimonas gallinarii TaxID=634155 RepID=A0A4R3L956_9GAMM|nr:amino acid permease [Pseudofulvimonas gallinarii]TCS96343.1 amino acid/polyamine/organocation transporter (APC superfamily) [Pseudofulvimonas gallinarii]THD14774.1 amino acid permease [Pseudofulvimonas gallinarii]
MLKGLFAIKPITPAPHVDAGEPVEGSLAGEGSLKRTLTATQLVMLGVGAVIGAGIFVLTGQAAAAHAGPAIVLSFVMAGFACALAGLCYAEFASMMPVSGSAYSYSYATLGEFVAWFIGWCLVLEYLFAASTVAVGWSGYLNSLLGTMNMALPDTLAMAPFSVVGGEFIRTGAIINLPAVLIIAAISGLCYVGITQSAFVNSIIVAIKVTVILLFVAFGLQFVDTSNWVPFIPENTGPGQYGFEGVVRGASIVFFAYIGFDAVSTAAGEARNPQRDMPIGILVSLAVCTLIYIIVCAVLTGMVHYSQLGTAKPVATALEAYPSLLWLKTLIEIGAIAGLSSVILVMLMGQPRIFYSMAKDGLLPKVFGKVHPKYQTPYMGTIIVGVTAAVLAGFLPINLLGEMVSMGTLLAFATVCAGVLILRFTQPNLKRPFRVPGAILVCPLGVAACLYLFVPPFAEHWPIFVGWTALGMLIYFGYGYWHSKLRTR